MKGMSEDKWLMLAKLMQRYSSLQDAINVLESLYPDDAALSQMKQSLEKGMPVSSLLQKKGFEGQVRFYCQYIPLSEAVLIVTEKQKKQKALQKQFIGKVAYQMFVLLMSFVVLAVFTIAVLPQMIDVLQISGSRSEGLVLIFDVLEKIIIVMAIVIAVSAVVICYIILRQRQTYIWMLAHKHKWDYWFCWLATYRFANNLKVLIDHGIDLKEAVSIVRFDNQDKMSALLAYHFNEMLNQGTSLEDALQMEFFDPQFAHICLYGLLDHDFSFALEDYLLVTQEKAAMMIRKASVVINLICYAFAFVVIVLAYQVLFLPMELLEGL